MVGLHADIRPTAHMYSVFVVMLDSMSARCIYGAMFFHAFFGVLAFG